MIRHVKAPMVVPALGTPPKTIEEFAGREAIIVGRGDRVRYSSPLDGGAEYISVCPPAFAPETAHRDED